SELIVCLCGSKEANRDNNRASRSALFDNLEEGGLRASSSSSYSDEHENEKSLNSLQDRVVFLKRLTGDIHEEVQSHNRMLHRMGNGMDSARGIMSGTMDKFKMVTFEIFDYLVPSASSGMIARPKPNDESECTNILTYLYTWYTYHAV
ncbi:hypothetical protein M8C21_012503, partial [Ambrosia artemisiifolia]